MSKEGILKGFRSEFSEYLRPKTIGVFDSILLANEFEEYLTKAIDQTRKETIKEILSQLRLKLRNTYKAEDIADTAFLTESDLESVLKK